MSRSTKHMAHPLHLTVDEKKLFAKLPENLREGWEVKEEKGEYEDTDKKKMLRMAFLNLTDPKLQDFQKKAQHAKSADELIALTKTLTLTAMLPEDLRELLFAMGSDGMTGLLAVLLTQAQTDEDLDAISFISSIRELFFKAAPVA